MKYPTVAFFSIDGKWYKSRTVFYSEKEEQEWLAKYRDQIEDLVIVEATELDIKDSLEEGEEFILSEGEDEEDSEER